MIKRLTWIMMLMLVLVALPTFGQGDDELAELLTLQEDLQLEIDTVAAEQLADPTATVDDIMSIQEESAFNSEQVADAVDIRALEEGVPLEQVAPSEDESVSDFVTSEVLTNPTSMGLLGVVALLLGWLFIRLRRPKSAKTPDSKLVSESSASAGDNMIDKKSEELEKSKTELIRSDMLFSDILDKELIASEKNMTVAPRGIDALEKRYSNLLGILEDERNGFPEGLFSFKDKAFNDQFEARKEDIMRGVKLNEEQYAKLHKFSVEIRDRVLKRLGRLKQFKLRKYDFSLACTILSELNWYRVHLEKIKPLEGVCKKLEVVVRKDLELVNRELHDELDHSIAEWLNGLRETVHNQLEIVRGHIDFLNYWLALEKRVFSGKGEGYKPKYKSYILHRQFSNALKSEDTQEMRIRKQIADIRFKGLHEETDACLTEDQVRRLKQADIKGYQIEIGKIVGDVLEIVGKDELHFRYGDHLGSVTIGDMRVKHFCIRHKKKADNKDEKAA